MAARVSLQLSASDNHTSKTAQPPPDIRNTSTLAVQFRKPRLQHHPECCTARVVSAHPGLPCFQSNAHGNPAELAAVRLKREHRNSRWCCATAADKGDACTSLLRRLVMREVVDGSAEWHCPSPAVSELCPMELSIIDVLGALDTGRTTL